MLYNKAIGATASGQKVYIEEVFQTFLYTGNGSTQTITNGIDLSGKGGLVWLKDRTRANNNLLFDTERGALNVLHTNVTGGQYTYGNSLLSFGATGFEVGSNGEANENGFNYVSWTFRKAAKFFDVVTYTGNGTATKTVNHALGASPGCVIIKKTSATGQWCVFHNFGNAGDIGSNDVLFLNRTNALSNFASAFEATASTFVVPNTAADNSGVAMALNDNGATYVAYLFADDAGGFGDSGNDNVISCGSFTTTSSPSLVANLGWEPQWVLVKSTNNTYAWWQYDNMRGASVGEAANIISPNNSAAEAPGGAAFTISNQGIQFTGNLAGLNCIYIAIRRGPMKTPTDATKVFATQTFGGGGTAPPAFVSGFPVDLGFYRQTNATSNWITTDRLRGNPELSLNLTTAESANTVQKFDYQNGYYDSTGSFSQYRSWMFRRAPGFFDVVAYTGNNTSQAVLHNLGKAPDLIIVKSRDQGSFRQWAVYSSVFSNTDALYLNLFDAKDVGVNYWNTTTPSASSFSVGSSTLTNGGSEKYIAYLFASCPGVSKVGSYTGSGTTKQIDCGFTNGAKFVLIKRTDSTGDWYVWDTARGIVSGNDNYLLLNSTAAEVTNTDYIDPYSAGFEISSTAPAAINANGGSFIYLAVA